MLGDVARETTRSEHTGKYQSRACSCSMLQADSRGEGELVPYLAYRSLWAGSSKETLSEKDSRVLDRTVGTMEDALRSTGASHGIGRSTWTVRAAIYQVTSYVRILYLATIHYP